MTPAAARGYTWQAVARITNVDGYNVIKRDPALAQLQGRSLELARDALVRRLNADPSLRHNSITVVFDGAKGGQPYEHAEQKGRVRVLYSRLGESADEVIKRLVDAAAGEVRVISNDRELRDHTSWRGGTPVRVVPRQRFAPTSHEEDEEDAPRPSKKGPAWRPKKRRRGEPFWSP